MSATNLDRASMEDFRNMAAALADAEARLAAVEALADEWESNEGTVACDAGCVYALRAVVRADPPA